MKRFIAMMVCCVLILGCVFQLAGCSSGESSATDEVVAKYVEAQKNFDKEALVELLPPGYYEHLVEKYTSEPDNMSEEKAKEFIIKNYQTYISNIDMGLVNFANGNNVYDYFTYDYKIGRKYTATEKEVKELSDYNTETNGLESEIENAEIVEITSYAKNPDGDVAGDRTEYLVCMQIDGQWYLFEYSNYENNDMWSITVEKTEPYHSISREAQVQWIKDVTDEWYNSED